MPKYGAVTMVYADLYDDPAFDRDEYARWLTDDKLMEQGLTRTGPTEILWHKLGDIGAATWQSHGYEASPDDYQVITITPVAEDPPPDAAGTAPGSPPTGTRG